MVHPFYFAIAPSFPTYPLSCFSTNLFTFSSLSNFVHFKIYHHYCLPLFWRSQFVTSSYCLFHGTWSYLYVKRQVNIWDYKK